MSSDAPTEANAGLSPSEAFALLGHEHRVAILEALLSLLRTREEYPASFSTLREAAGIDVSSQFNYHLRELTGHYLERSEEGYEFRVAGWEIATSILAGTYNQRDRICGLHIDGTCPLCEARDLAVSYVDEWLAVECRACDAGLTRLPLAPGALADRAPAEFLRVFDRDVRNRVRLARDRVCPSCMGRMHPATRSDEPEKTAGKLAGYWCERCGNRLHPCLGMVLFETLEVRAFYREQGVDVDAKPHWEFRPCVDRDLVTVVSDGPWRCEVRYPLEETLEVTVDDELEITDTAVTHV